MLTKTYSNSGHTCKVTFEIENPAGANNATLCGDFNNWEPTAYPMEQRPDGSFWLTITLEAGKSYRFKYLLDGQFWENDWDADSYVANDYSGEDSVVNV